ncbi:MAG: carbon-nitrogen hydrolase family protein [Chloroflexi bacterium]|nr:carbon-nitrogen hydrolase family protein [Chloroflexota bacterium]
MKNKVRVAAVQMDVKGLDVEANLAHMIGLIGQVTEEGPVDVLVFPELANSGYVKGGDPVFSKEFVLRASRVPGDIIDALSSAASAHGVYLAVGLLRAHPDIPYTLYNSAVLIGPDGRLIGVHDKAHLPFEERHFFYPGNTAGVFDTDIGKLAVQVCADASFPELCRVFALRGAEIVCTVYNCPWIKGKDFISDRIMHQSVVRAQENTLFFIGCNRVGSDQSGAFCGRSCIAGPLGQILAHSETDQEEIIRATLDEEVLREARAFSPYFRDRRPELYGLITKPF